MTIQQSSPGNQRLAMALTWLSWLLFGIIYYLRSHDTLAAGMSTVLIAIIYVVFHLNYQRGFDWLGWHPAITFWTVAIAHFSTWIFLVPENFAVISFTICLGLYTGIPHIKQSKTSRTAKDLGV